MLKNVVIAGSNGAVLCVVKNASKEFNDISADKERRLISYFLYSVFAV